MDSTDYVNVYIDLLNKRLHDEVNRGLMHEARIILLEKVNADLNQKLQDAQLELDKYKKKKVNVEAGTE